MKLSTRELIICSLFASITAILSQIAIPVTTVPFTMQIFGVMLCGMLLGEKLGFISQVIYLLLGAIGMPVFAEMSGGLGIIFGPTGGFILSFPIVTYIVGRFSNQYKSKIILILGMVLGLVVSYLIGTIQFCFITKASFISGIMMCVTPFIIFDLLKIVLAYSLGSIVYKRVSLVVGI
ncbi:MAG: biotin transporter BioY [Romboutsia sp.]